VRAPIQHTNTNIIYYTNTTPTTTTTGIMDSTNSDGGYTWDMYERQDLWDPNIVSSQIINYDGGVVEVRGGGSGDGVSGSGGWNTNTTAPAVIQVPFVNHGVLRVLPGKCIHSC